LKFQRNWLLVYLLAFFAVSAVPLARRFLPPDLVFLPCLVVFWPLGLAAGPLCVRALRFVRLRLGGHCHPLHRRIHVKVSLWQLSRIRRVVTNRVALRHDSMVVGTCVGALSDKYGRRNMCILFSIFYFISGFYFWGGRGVEKKDRKKPMLFSPPLLVSSGDEAVQQLLDPHAGPVPEWRRHVASLFNL
jgi:hypothetical protein